jgi:hypothetical protein
VRSRVVEGARASTKLFRRKRSVESDALTHPAPRKRGRGTARRAVEGARAATNLFRRKRSGESDAPSTTLRVVPLPRYRGGGRNRFSFSRCAFCLRPSFANGFHERPPEKEGGEAPKGAPTMSAPHIGALPSRSARARALRKPARLPALHRGSCLATECFDSAQAALHAIERERALPAPSIALKPSTWLAGLNAGGDDARTARERSVSLRPREPHSLPSVSTLGRKVPR